MPTRKNKGFTLIELLVVISIIGLLSSIVLVSLTSTKKKAQIAKTLTEMNSIQNALELYASNHNGSYPPNNLDPNSLGWSDDYDGSTALQTALQPLVTEKYLSSVPHAPYYPSNKGSYILGYITPEAQNYYVIKLYCGNNPLKNYQIFLYASGEKLKLQNLTYTQYLDPNHYDLWSGDISPLYTYCIAD